MKRTQITPAWQWLFLILILITLSYCTDKNNPQPMEPPIDVKPSTRPVGTSAGEPYYEWIGTAGGTMKSPDGTVELVFPAGALDEDTEIGIEPIKNTGPGGKGNSFRLTPHGKTFKKPVTIRFNYGKQQQFISSAKPLEIAYQDDKGIWTCVGKTQLDETRKTVSVQTDHFSDWTIIASMELTPVVTTVGLGEQVSLKAIRYVFPLNNDDFLVPLSVPAGTGDPVKLESTYIVGWTLSGPGKLEGKGSEAVYTAPSSAPANNTATVTVELNFKGKKVLLISTIYIVKDGISISIDGGPWITYPAMAGKAGNFYNMNNIKVSEDQPQITFLWPAGNQSSNGQYSWSMFGPAEANSTFQYFVPGLTHVYASIYKDGPDVFDSGGFLSVEESQEGSKKYISGVFAVDQAGFFEKTTDGKQLKISSVKGIYKVQRRW